MKAVRNCRKTKSARHELSREADLGYHPAEVSCGKEVTGKNHVEEQLVGLIDAARAGRMDEFEFI